MLFLALTFGVLSVFPEIMKNIAGRHTKVKNYSRSSNRGHRGNIYCLDRKEDSISL